MSYLDGLDWSPLGLGSNPVPGDPPGVNALAAKLEGLADDADGQNQHLRSIGGSTSEFWQGPAASEVQGKLGKLPGELDKLVNSYRDAAKALRGYQPKLDNAQQDVHKALLIAQQAQSDIDGANQQLSAAQGQVSSTGAAYNQAVAAQNPPPLPPGAPPPPPPDPAQVAQAQAATSQAQAAYQQAQGQVQAANQALSQAQGRLAQAKQMASDAVKAGSRAADGLASALHDASKAGIPNKHHHWYDAPLDVAEDVLSGGAHIVEHAARDVADLQIAAGAWAAGSVGLIPKSEEKQLLKQCAPGLNQLSGALGVVSIGLAVVGFIPVVGELADVANEGVNAIKTETDGLRLAAGETSAADDLLGDAFALGTGGMGRLADGAGDAVKAEKDLGDAEKAFGNADREASSLEGKASEASSKADDLRGQAAGARNEAAANDREANTMDGLASMPDSGEAATGAAAARDAASSARDQAAGFDRQAAEHESVAADSSRQAQAIRQNKIGGEQGLAAKLHDAREGASDAAGGKSFAQFSGARTISQMAKNGVAGSVKSEAGVDNISEIRMSNFTHYVAERYTGAGAGYHWAARTASTVDHAVAVHGLNTSPDPAHQIKGDFNHMMGHNDEYSIKG